MGRKRMPSPPSGRAEAAPGPPPPRQHQQLLDGAEDGGMQEEHMVRRATVPAPGQGNSTSDAVVTRRLPSNPSLPPNFPSSSNQSGGLGLGSTGSGNGGTGGGSRPIHRHPSTLRAGMDEKFSLHPPTSARIPLHVWDAHGGMLHLPRTLALETQQARARLGRKIHSLIHIPTVPLRRNWRFCKQHALADLCAGITLGIMVIPQGMAYMLLASIPSIIGLHTATIGCFLFAFLGTTRNILSVGPVALASIYLPTALTQLGFNTQLMDPQAQLDRAAAASALTFWIGVVFLIMSVFRLGNLIRFLSFSVMSGFTSAAGLYVGLSQVKHLLSIHPPQFRYHFQEFAWLVTHVHESNPRTAALGFSALAILLAIKMVKRRYPPTPEREKRLSFRVWRFIATFATLVVVVLASAVAYGLERHDKGIPIVGKIEPGLSRAAFPSWSKLGLPTQGLIIQSLPLAMLAFMETYSVGRKCAEENRVQLDQNQDLFALGVGNLISSCFSTFVAAGSFGRTALAQEVGARSAFSNVWMGLLIILTLSCFTEALEFIPLAVLGAVIEAAIINLIDFAEMRRALRVAPLSGCVMLFTFVCTLMLTIETGLLYGVLSSLAILLYQLSSVTLTALGIEEDDGLRFVSLDEHPHASKAAQGIAVIRPVTSLFFGNACSFKARLHRLLSGGGPREDAWLASGGGGDSKLPASGDGVDADAEAEAEAEDKVDEVDEETGAGAGPRLRHVLIDACAVRVLDLTALGAIADVVEEAGEKGVSVVLTNTSHALKKSLALCGLLERLGGTLVTMSTEEVYTRLLTVQGKMQEHQQQPPPQETNPAAAGAREQDGEALSTPGRPRSDSAETFHRRLHRAFSQTSQRLDGAPSPGTP